MATSHSKAQSRLPSRASHLKHNLVSAFRHSEPSADNVGQSTGDSTSRAMLLGSDPKVGRLAAVATVVDVIVHLDNDPFLDDGEDLCQQFFKMLRFDLNSDEATNDLFMALYEATSTKTLQEARQFQSLVQRIIAENRKALTISETKLAALVVDLMQPVEQNGNGGSVASKSNDEQDQNIVEAARSIAKLRRKIELFVEKGILLAVLHRMTEDNLQTVVRTVIEDGEPLVNDSVPAECT